MNMKRTVAAVKMIFTCGLFLILVGLIIFRRDEIKSILDNHVFHNRDDVTLENHNEYYRDYDFMFVKKTDNFTPNRTNPQFRDRYIMIDVLCHS